MPPHPDLHPLLRERVCVDCGCTLTALLGLCADCGEVRRTRDLEARRLAEQKARQRAWLAICPPLYRHTDWAQPELAPGLVALAQDWHPGQDGRHSLLMTGATGLGKTRAAFAMLHRLHQAGRSVYALHAGDAWDCGSHLQGLASAVRLQYHEDPRVAQTAAHCLHRARTCGVLLLDDLGKERAAGQTGQLSEAVGEALFGLIEHRLVHTLPLILTTNATGPMLEHRLGPDRGAPLMRRLMESSLVMDG